MQKNKWLYVFALSAMLLASCGGDDSSSSSAGDIDSSSSDSVVEDPSSSTSGSGDVEGPSPITGKGIDLQVRGGFFVGNSRSVYVTFQQEKRGNVIFETSDETTATISSLQDLMVESGYDYTLMPEALVTPKCAGKFFIHAYLEDDPSIEVKRYYEIKDKDDGEVMPEETFNLLTSSLKVETTQEQYAYDLNYQEKLEYSYELTTIFEETGAASTDASIGPRTDAYSLTEKNTQTGAVKTYKYVRTPNNKVGREYVSIENQVLSEKIVDEDGYDYAWGNSAYTNFFADETIVTNESFVSFDKGASYHFVGEWLDASYLCYPLFLAGFTPDDIILFMNKDGTIGFHIQVEPTFDSSTHKNDVKYGQILYGTFSEFGTAEIEHAKPYEHQDYHDAIGVALEKMKNARNYKVHFTYDYSSDNSSDVDETLIFEENTIDQSYSVGTNHYHTGIRKVDDTHYFKYTVNSDNQVEKNSTVNAYWHDASQGVVRYPTFRGAPEIYTKNQDGSYSTSADHGVAIIYMSYLPTSASYVSWDSPVTITLNEDGHIATASTKGTYFDEEVTLNIEFSEFGTASTGLDFENIVDNTVAHSWEEDPEAQGLLIKNMNEWTVEGVPLPQVLPFLDSPVGWAGVVGWLQSKPTFCYVSTGKFLNADKTTDQASLDKFIADYQAVLVASGYVATSETDPENDNAILYKNAKNYKISVHQEKNSWNAYYQPAVKICFHVDDASKIHYEDSFVE